MKRHSKWMRWGVLTAACAMMAAAPAMGEEATEAASTEQTADLASVGEQTVLSDTLYDFQIQIDGTVYQFPMSYEAFKANGWEMDTDYTGSEEDEIEPNQYGIYYFSKDDVTCTAYVLNLGINNLPASQCLVGGISIDGFDWDVNTGEILMAGGIQRGVSTLEDIQRLTEHQLILMREIRTRLSPIRKTASAMCG